MRQPCMKRLLASSACLALILALAQGESAQAAGPEGGARMFDSFNLLRGCDLGARLDNLAIALQSDEGVAGYIISYGPAGEGPGTGSYNLLVMTDYLVNNRGIEKERLRTVYGGRYTDPKELATELWIVPLGAQPPELKKYKSKLKNIRGKYEEFMASDNFYEGMGEGTGPYAGDPSFASFRDALRERTSARAYVVVRSSPRAAPGAWRRVAKRIAENLEESPAITSDRVKIIFAGYDGKLARDEEEGDAGAVKVQLWILPEDAPPPAKEAADERRPSEAALIGALSQYTLPYPNNVKHVFEGLADVLSADRELRACIIYRPSTIPPDPEFEPDPEPRVDLTQLVEKWKGELTTRYKIDEARLVVISAAATRVENDGTVEAWVVPPGADLPDAYPPPAVEEEYVEEAAEEYPQNF
ncbi:MAG TPA: hypothetical protein VD861_08670 [Pyrinomonadaceae bacterium]|nr:hypothetical protein [Pyrinomonadaceae bacterium]